MLGFLVHKRLCRHFLLMIHAVAPERSEAAADGFGTTLTMLVSVLLVAVLVGMCIQRQRWVLDWLLSEMKWRLG